MSDQKTVMKEMMASAVHFGHKTSKWNPKMAPYLFGEKNGVHIFDLNKTYVGLTKACEFLRGASAQGKKILFVSTKQQAVPFLIDLASATEMPYVTTKWIPGLLTNFKTIRARIKTMQSLRDERDRGELNKYTKKEASAISKSIDKFQTALGGVETLERIPDIVFILDIHRDKIAVKEAKAIGATVVAITDSNVNPDSIDYAIPGNDDAIRAIEFYFNNIKDAILSGKKK